MTTHTNANIDPREIDKFAAMAPRWWDPEGECKPLHDINPYRINFIHARAPLSGKTVLDVGCGGGILSESIAAKGANITGIDASKHMISVAKLHLLESDLSVDYQCITIEELASKHSACFDVITCMELLEHVPDPVSVIHSCATLLKPDGHLFLSTLNRNPKSFVQAIIGAEYILKMLPRGTHDYSHFIRPSELETWLRQADLSLRELKGLTYNPFFKCYALSDDITVNYLAHATF